MTLDLPAIAVVSETLPAARLSAADYARRSIPASTKRTYRAYWVGFESWCLESGHCPLPASPETVADYLASRAAEGRKVATVQTMLSAIGAAHRTTGYTLDTRTGLLGAALRGIRREHVAAQRQAKPLSRSDLVDAIKLMDEGVKGLRDRALLTFGLMAARRRSE